MNIGLTIKKLRKRNKITQLSLAKALNLADNTISQYENGICLPSDDIKIKLADYFGVSLDYLMGREEEFDGLNIITPPPAKSDIQTIYDALPPTQQRLLITYGQALIDNNQADYSSKPHTYSKF